MPLARENPIAAGVPETALAAAEGYARAAGIPYGQGLIKNRYIGRTFISPSQVQRDRGVRRKLNPLKENIAGKRVIVVDDSIVRGTTSRAIVRMLRDAGASEVHGARQRMGEALAAQAHVDADIVIGVPETALAAAEGYARAAGIPFGHGLVKNRYIGRTFIAPSQELRDRAVHMKLNPLRENLVGKRVVVIDDTIVRGTTQKQVTRMLREAGAAEVHLRITAPPVAWSCFYGIDTGDRTELLASSLAIDEIREYLNVDSLAFVNLDRLKTSTGAPGAGFCDACFTGDYPVAVPVTLRKHVLEEPAVPAPGTPVQTAID